MVIEFIPLLRHLYKLNSSKSKCFSKSLTRNKFFNCPEWKRISCKQSTRWLHLSRLKASSLFFFQKIVSCIKHNNLYLGLVTPSSRWWSPIAFHCCGYILWIYNFLDDKWPCRLEKGLMESSLMRFFVTGESHFLSINNHSFISKIQNFKRIFTE